MLEHIVAKMLVPDHLLHFSNHKRSLHATEDLYEFSMEVPIEQEMVLQQIHIDNTDVSFCRIKGPPPITAVQHATTYLLFQNCSLF
jgi:hypothetical protein